MKQYIKSEMDMFEIVDSVPAGYEIWNIGTNMPDGYLPLCMPIAHGSYTINPDTLKAIKIDGAQTILAAIGGGQNTIESMERYVKRYSTAKPGTYTHAQVKRMEKALPIMRQIKWN